MKRLIEKMGFCGFVTCWRFAGAPTSRWPSLVNPTTDGVVRPPSAFGMTTGSPPSIVVATELVVPRSMPMTLSAISLVGRFLRNAYALCVHFPGWLSGYSRCLVGGARDAPTSSHNPGGKYGPFL